MEAAPFPDGKTIVLMTLSDGQSQLALMRPETGDWTLLTHPSSRERPSRQVGRATAMRIFIFQRMNVASTVRSIPSIGGPERAVMDRATYPEPLPDGTILAARFNEQGVWQLCRLWPDSSRSLAFDIEHSGTACRFRFARSLPASVRQCWGGDSARKGGHRCFWLILNPGPSRREGNSHSSRQEPLPFRAMRAPSSTPAQRAVFARSAPPAMTGPKSSPP